MREIALDTQASTTVAVLEDGRVRARARNDSGRHHAESIIPLVRAALAEAGLSPVLGKASLDRVLIGTGPAPFTGLRAGLVSARVLAAAAGVPVYGVSPARAWISSRPRRGSTRSRTRGGANSTGVPTWPPDRTT